MADCEKAKKYVQDYLEENDLEGYVSADQVKDAVSACCDDFGSQDCVNAIAALSATAGCVALTDGACVPCCEAAGAFVGPIVGESLGWAWGAIKDGWDWVTSWFSGGGCDYDPAADKLVKAYDESVRRIAAGLDVAWATSRQELGLEPKSPLFASDFPGGLMLPVALTEESIVANMGDIVAASWQQALLHSSIRLCNTLGPPQYTYKLTSKDDKMHMPRVSVDDTHEPYQFFHFRWYNWDCKEANQWEVGAKKMLDIRMGFVRDAADRISRQMALALSKEADEVYADKQVLRNMASAARVNMRSDSLRQLRQDEQSSPLLWLLGATALGVAGWYGYRYVKKQG